MSSTQSSDAGIGHNKPPDEIDPTFENIKQRVSDLVAAANRWINERPEITDEEMAGRCSAFIDQLQAHLKDVEATRKRQVAPLNAEVKAINARYKDQATFLEKARAAMRQKLDPWLKAERERVEAERRKAEAEAEAKRKEAEEAARKAEEEAKGDVIGAQVAAEQAEEAAKEAEAAAKRAQRQKAGVKPSVGSGKAKTIRKRTVVRIADRSLIPARVLRMVDDDAILKVLRADLDLARKTPGVVVEIEEQVV